MSPYPQPIFSLNLDELENWSLKKWGEHVPLVHPVAPPAPTLHRTAKKNLTEIKWKLQELLSHPYVPILIPDPRRLKPNGSQFFGQPANHLRFFNHVVWLTTVELVPYRFVSTFCPFNCNVYFEYFKGRIFRGRSFQDTKQTDFWLQIRQNAERVARIYFRVSAKRRWFEVIRPSECNFKIRFLWYCISSIRIVHEFLSTQHQ